MCEFCDFWRIKCIFTQPVTKEDASFVNFWRYDLICTHPIGEKNMCLKKNSCLVLKKKIKNLIWQLVIKKKC